MGLSPQTPGLSTDKESPSSETRAAELFVELGGWVPKKGWGDSAAAETCCYCAPILPSSLPPSSLPYSLFFSA